MRLPYDMSPLNHDLPSILDRCRVLPVITPGEIDRFIGLIGALHAGGMAAVEVTLRSDTALECIAECRRQFPDMVVAAGTVLDPAGLERATAAGAHFSVSPGLTPALLDAARDTGVALLPGVATASDIMLGLSRGLDHFKFFPASAAGGIGMLKAFAGPFQSVKFCPTGGLRPDNFRDYLALPNVICCGGSWMVAAQLVESENWEEVSRLAGEAVTGKRSGGARWFVRYRPYAIAERLSTGRSRCVDPGRVFTISRPQ